MNNIVCHIASIRRASKTTQEDLARMAGITRKELCAIERGRVQPDIDLLFCLAEVLCCPVDALYERVKKGSIARGGRFIDLTRRRFGKLVAIERIAGTHAHKGEAFWRCKCDCGGEAIVRSDHLRDGHSQSCGCATPNTLIENNRVNI